MRPPSDRTGDQPTGLGSSGTAIDFFKLSLLLASSLSYDRRFEGVAMGQVRKAVQAPAAPHSEPHPVWLEPEMAKLLDEHGFRRFRAQDVYVGPAGIRITETQLLTREVESLRRFIAVALKRAQTE